MEAVCAHGFSLPAIRYGDVLLPPNACHACRSDDSFGTTIRSGDPYPSVTNEAFTQESWDSDEHLLPQNNNNLSNVQSFHKPNTFEPSPSDSLAARTKTHLPESQDSTRQQKSGKPSPFNVLFLDANKTSHVAKRRGPLTEDGRDNVKRLRTMGGACWRCKVLKKQCDGETPCKECSTGESRKWHLDCQRGNIKDIIKGKIPDLALGTGEWFVPLKNGRQYRVRITHDTLDPESVFRDCIHLAGDVTSSSQAELSILEFVEQFYDVDTRWQESEKPTLEFLKKCARLQADTLCNASCDRGMPSRVLIALSLRCLMLTREVGLFSMSMDDYMSMEPRSYGDCSEDETLIKQKTSDGSLIEIIELQTSDKHERHTHKHINGKSISQSLEDILYLTQNLMMRRKPQDWPMLLCTLGLLGLITETFSLPPDLPFDTFAEDSYGALDKANDALCSLFEIMSKGLHPLYNKWNKEAYSRLVDGNDDLVGTFQWIHDQWLEGVYDPPSKCRECSEWWC